MRCQEYQRAHNLHLRSELLPHLAHEAVYRMFSDLQKTARQVETAFFGLTSPNRNQRLAVLNDDGPYRGHGVTVPGAPA